MSEGLACGDAPPRTVHPHETECNAIMEVHLSHSSSVHFPHPDTQSTSHSTAILKASPSSSCTEGEAWVWGRGCHWHRWEGVPLLRSGAVCLLARLARKTMCFGAELGFPHGNSTQTWRWNRPLRVSKARRGRPSSSPHKQDRRGEERRADRAQPPPLPTCTHSARSFDPAVYRIVLFDQRGAGKSKPQSELEDNTTWDLVEDIEKVRVE